MKVPTSAIVKKVAIVACPHKSTSSSGEKNLTLKSALSLGKTKAVSETANFFEMYFICSSASCGEFNTTPAGFPPCIESVNALTFLTIK